jgi:hypothetical protein
MDTLAASTVADVPLRTWCTLLLAWSGFYGSLYALSRTARFDAFLESLQPPLPFAGGASDPHASLGHAAFRQHAALAAVHLLVAGVHAGTSIAALWYERLADDAPPGWPARLWLAMVVHSCAFTAVSAACGRHRRFDALVAASPDSLAQPASGKPRPTRYARVHIRPATESA